MSLLTKASLVATPTAYGDGVLNSVKPTNGDGDFDFARASSATRVNEQGLIEKERENLLLQSNSFDTTWSATRSTLTSGAAGYDDTNDAWNFIDNATNSTHLIAQSLSVGAITSTFSVYAKAAAVDFLSIRFEGSTVDYAYFDLANGVLGTIDSDYIDAQIISVGSGWYRCIVTRVLAGSGNQVVLLATQADNDPTYAGAGTTALYIQDAQVEYGLVATDYIETTTTSVAVGITNDIPRINYENGIGNFLLEPQRTNSVTHSEYFSTGSGYWGNIRSTIVSNDIVSPEGVQNGSKLLQDSGTTNAGLLNATITASGTNTFSFYAKKGSVNFANLSLYSSVDTSVYFDLVNGEIGTTNLIAESDCFIEDAGDGWYRCGATYSGTTNRFNIYLADRDGESTLLDASNAYIYIYGAQWEQSSSYATSYIPTFGSAVTRLAETCNNAGNSDLFNDSEGVLYAEIAALADDATVHPITLGDGTSSNRIQLFYFNGVSIYGACIVGGVSQASIFKNTNVTNYIKAAFKYKANDFSLWVNGFEVGVDVGGSVPIGLNTLNFDNGVGAVDFYGKTKMVSTFKEALSDSELECLTSWSSFNRMATAQNYTIQ